MNARERSHEITEQRELIDRQFRVWCKDTFRNFDVFRVPVKALLLNVDNRRFKAERKLVEEMLGRELDPENNPEDELSVIAILLDSGLDREGDYVKGKPTKDTESLKEDWLRRHQENPFWIRPDGTVHNGNRRLALIKRLQNEGGTEGLEWVEAIILDPSDVDEEELFTMEQREQLTENLKVRYTDINLLLALRDAAILEGIDWGDQDSITQVAGRLQQVAGGDRTYAAIQLQAIKYMDAYLADLNAPGEYQRLRGLVERFRDVGKMMSVVQDQYPDDAADMLQLAFSAIQAGSPHGDIRALRKMLIADRARYQRLLDEVTRREDEWRETTPAELANPDLTAVTTEPDEDDDADDVPASPVLPHYPKEEVRALIDNAIDGHRAASTLSVTNQLIQAVSRLEAVTPARLAASLATDEADDVRPLVSTLIEWAAMAHQTLEDS